MLNGALVEGEPAQDPVFLSDLEQDPGEQHNLKDQLPELTRELTEKATAWRAGIEREWKEKWSKNYAPTR